jgi:SAM-dependent methyltransferase
MSNDSLGPDYFERLYAAQPDPWNFATSQYEHEKYERTLAALGNARFAAALEIGCSVGVLTSGLAMLCDDLLAVDVNARAIASARVRCANKPNVRFARMTIPREFPPERFDLIVLSEVGYYWSDPDLEAVIDCIASSASGGLLELVHFLPKVDDYVRSGDAVHTAFLRDPRFAHVSGTRRERYRIDLLGIR